VSRASSYGEKQPRLGGSRECSHELQVCRHHALARAARQRASVRHRPSAPPALAGLGVTGPHHRHPAAESQTRARRRDRLAQDRPAKGRVIVYDGFGDPCPEPHGTVAPAFRQDSPGDDADIYDEVDVTETTTFMARESWHRRIARAWLVGRRRRATVAPTWRWRVVE